MCIFCRKIVVILMGDFLSFESDDFGCLSSVFDGFLMQKFIKGFWFLWV